MRTLLIVAISASACTPAAEFADGVDAGALPTMSYQRVVEGRAEDSDAGFAPAPDAAVPDADAAVPDADAAVPDAEPVAVEPVVANRPAAAFDGSNFMVVWTDERNGNHDIYGTRISPTGAVLDPDGIVIVVHEGVQSSPAIAFNGSHYLIAWKDSRTGSNAIYATRLSAQGEHLDATDLILSPTAGSIQHPAVASDGDGFLVTWEGPCGLPSCYHGINGAIVANDGAVSPPQRIATPSWSSSYTPAVAFANDHYLVVWADSRHGASDIYARRVSSSGDPVGDDLAISTAAGDQIVPALATSGDDFAIVWQDTRDLSVQTYAARVTSAGQLIDDQGLQVSTAARWQDAPTIVHDGTSYRIAWAANDDDELMSIYLRALTDDGLGGEVIAAVTVAQSDGLASASDKHPAFVAGAEATLVCWENVWIAGETLFGARVAEMDVLDREAFLVSTQIVR